MASSGNRSGAGRRPAMASGSRVVARKPPSFIERYRALIVGGVVAAAVVAAVIIFVLKFGPSKSGKEAAAGVQPADPAVVSALTGIPQSVFDAVGAGSATNAPKAAAQAPALTQDGKPEVLYMGAEYCPFCAAERWAMIAALSRFGSFSNLHTTTSSASDIYPSTPTFTFYGSSYTSQYVSFQSVELQTNQPNGSGGYTSLQSPTSDQQAVFSAYDKAPYTSSAGSIPFMDFGGHYILSGATYDAGLLQGKSWSQIAAALSDPNNPITKAIVGSANVLTAAICSQTGNQPANVCSTPGVQAAAATLGK